MDKFIEESLTASLEATRIHKIQPSKQALDDALAIQGYHLSNLSDQELTKHIFTLSQYQLFLQVQLNARNIEYIEAKRDYEFALSKEMGKLDADLTVKEKTAAALSNSETLQALEKEMRLKNSKLILFEKVPEDIGEIANAIKKELSIRPSTASKRF